MSIARQERRWQNARGGRLQEDAYERAGTREVLDRQHARIAEVAGLADTVRLLDIGCGVGHFLWWLARHYQGHLEGLDIAVGSLAVARRQSPELWWTAGAAEQLPYRDETFDRVVCNGSAHHIVDKQSAFHEMFRVLSPGGRLILHEPASQQFTTAIRSLFVRSDKYESPVDLALKEEFTVQRSEEMLRKAGFTHFVVSHHDWLAYPLSGNYFSTPFSRSRITMLAVLHFEDALDRLPGLRMLSHHLTWRTLLVCTKPGQGSASGNAATV